MMSHLKYLQEMRSRAEDPKEKWVRAPKCTQEQLDYDVMERIRVSRAEQVDWDLAIGPGVSYRP